MFSSFAACCFASFTSRNLPWRNSAISRALRSSPSTITSSPASGTSDRPWISTGIAGPALVTALPFSSVIARTRPNTAPASTMSPRFSVPECTSTVATGPLPLSRRDSMTMPRAGAFFGAFSSSTSACSRIASSSSSMPAPVFADTGMNCASPPYSSGITLSATSSCLTRSRFASGLSILLIATTIGTLPAFACAIASFVCGITPSSAATTRIDDVGDLRAARAHRRERLVARRVEERDHALLRLHVVGADVLRDPARLAARHARAADRVEQRRLAVVDVAHHRDDRRPRLGLDVGRFGFREQRVGIVELARPSPCGPFPRPG